MKLLHIMCGQYENFRLYNVVYIYIYIYICVCVCVCVCVGGSRGIDLSGGYKGAANVSFPILF
jgi:preprotein translocase subunit SecF